MPYGIRGSGTNGRGYIAETPGGAATGWAPYRREPGTENFKSDEKATRQTANTATNTVTTPASTNVASQPPKVIKPKESNVLNKYRSFTYNFTLSGLRRTEVNDPSSYRKSESQLTILKSGGRGDFNITGAIDTLRTQTATSTTSVTRVQKSWLPFVKDKTTTEVTTSTKVSIVADPTGKKLVEEYNRSDSPGRFDMYIDNVEIETLMAFAEEGGTTLPTTIKFDVFEPYSINGFIEALHVTSVAAGYTNYTQASFLLKLDFIGYPDDQELPTPQIVERSTRYFPIILTQLTIDITEKGTKYSCSAVPFNEKGFGQSSVVKKPIKMEGKKVQEILENFMKNLTEQQKTSDDKSKVVTENAHDSYKIKFLDYDPTRGYFGTTNKIGGSDVTKLLKDSTIYKFPDPGKETTRTSQDPKATNQPKAEENAKLPESVKYEPANSKAVVHISENSKVYEVIAAVIRDSEFVRDKLQKFIPDPNGFLDYFLIKLEVTNKDIIDDRTQKPFQEFCFVVTPYKVHFSRLPNYGKVPVDTSKQSLLARREYNYIYTGQNVDVIDFKLNFNNLFFEAIPMGMGNSDINLGNKGAANTNSTEPQTTPSNTTANQSSQNPSPGTREEPTPQVPRGGTGGPQDLSAYGALAKHIHQAIVNAKASMITGELNILGDPFYLVTGGIGNYRQVPDGYGSTRDGEADHNLGEVLIVVNFRNPLDIGSLESGGLYKFDSKKVPFSGIYRVLKANSTFRDGKFLQKLDIVRASGQVDNSFARDVDVSKVLQTTPNPDDKILPQTGPALTDPGQRPNDATLLDAQQRGLPSPGLPGILSNFTKAIGGLGGNIAPLLSQVSGGVTNGLGKLLGANSVFGSSIPGGVNQFATGIRLQVSGLIDTAQAKLSSAATLVQSGNTLNTGIGIGDGASTLATQISNQATKLVNTIGVAGSGIGEGATVVVDKIIAGGKSLVTGVTAQTDLSTTGVVFNANTTDISGVLSRVGSNALTAATNLGTSAAGIANNVKDNITNLVKGTPTDPTAIAAKFGINMSQLSGLSDNLKSKVIDQLKDLSSSFPANTDVSAAAAQGVVLSNLTKADFSNLPPTAPYVTAPAPTPDTTYLQSLVASGGTDALAKAYGVNSLKDIPGGSLSSDTVKSVLSSSPSGLNNPLGNGLGLTSIANATAVAGKLDSVRSQVDTLAGAATSVENRLNSVNSGLGSPLAGTENLSSTVIAKYGSKTAGGSPLDKIMTG